MFRLAVLAGLVAPCGALAQAFPEFADARLTAGREVWLGTCQVCHAEPASGAPLLGDRKAWAPRLAKGKPALYRSALGGLVGPRGGEMPARGGNASLSDEQIRTAVDYMTAAATK